MHKNIFWAFFLIIIFFFIKNTNAQVPNYADSIITMSASNRYHSGIIGNLFLGSHYRKVWAAPVTIHYLDPYTEAGGLTPIMKGGGIQTKSLKLLGNDCNQYVIRTIDKDPSKALSGLFQKSFVADILQDQISASHPYGALVIPGLADAAHVNHTNPKLLYVPKDSAFGEYAKDFGGQMVLFEVKQSAECKKFDPNEPDDMVSTENVYKNIFANSNNTVDERLFLRSRLFDMWVGDWDRHEDQWRWVQLVNKDGIYFKPVPRDRDQVFFNFDGIIPTYASFNIASTRKMQKFVPKMRSVKWFNFNARNIDRSFLNQASHDDWMQIADSMKNEITDKQVDDAFKVWPDTVFKLGGAQIVKTLKARRENLPDFADKYYHFLARQVNVVGSNQQEYFDVQRNSDGKTDVNVYQLNNGVKGKEIYHRTFLKDETKEIRLYGLSGNDVFNISGDVKKSIKLRVIGGDGVDSIIDHSHVGGGKCTDIYDVSTGNYIDFGKEGKNRTSEDTSVNAYNPQSYLYNFTGFTTFFGYNADDGLLIGGGVNIKTNGFRQLPFAAYQHIVANFSTTTSAFNFRYNGQFTDVFGKLDLSVAGVVGAPNHRQNFFGLGNETTKNDSLVKARYYELHINQGSFYPSVLLNLGKKSSVQLGPQYSFAKLDDTRSSILTTLDPELTTDDFVLKHFVGVNAQFHFEKYDNDTLPRKGIKLFYEVGNTLEVEDQTVNFLHLGSEMSFFFSINKPFLITFAERCGAQHNIGKFEFYQANTIGGKTSIRGLLGERFSGRTDVYNNLEARIHLFNVYSFLPGQVGLIVFTDEGRVWQDVETSSVIHTSFGGGFYLSPFNKVNIATTYAVSDDDMLLNIKLGYWF